MPRTKIKTNKENITSMANETTTKEQADMLVKIMVLESKLIDSQRSYDRLSEDVIDLYNRLEILKDEVRDKVDISNIEPKLKTIESDIKSIKLELPELLLIKRMFMGLIAFILTAFLALIWNSLVLHSPTGDKGDLDEIAKKVVDEYNKGGKK